MQRLTCVSCHSWTVRFSQKHVTHSRKLIIFRDDQISHTLNFTGSLYPHPTHSNFRMSLSLTYTTQIRLVRAWRPSIRQPSLPSRHSLSLCRRKSLSRKSLDQSYLRSMHSSRAGTGFLKFKLDKCKTRLFSISTLNPETPFPLSNTYDSMEPSPNRPKYSNTSSNCCDNHLQRSNLLLSTSLRALISIYHLRTKYMLNSRANVRRKVSKLYLRNSLATGD